MTPSTVNPSFDVFISYHSGDASWVSRLKEALGREGIRVWLDTEQIRPGDLFPGSLARAIGDVSCVVVVLSRGSIASRWVEEEYSLALARGRHTIAVLADDIEPPGFLAGRTFVDFRDEDNFAVSLQQLLFGITGTRAQGTAPAPAPQAAFGSADDGGTDEAEVLSRLIERNRRHARGLWRARIGSAVLGLLLGATTVAVASDLPMTVRLTAGTFAPVVLCLVGWGLTTIGLTRIDAKVEQFELLRDGLEACRSRSHPGCRRLRQQFWDMLSRATDAVVRPI